MTDLIALAWAHPVPALLAAAALVLVLGFVLHAWFPAHRRFRRDEILEMVRDLRFVWVALFLLALAAAVVTLLATIVTPGAAGLGTGALIVALLGAPFLIWRTWVADQTLRAQREGQITDRISKAVEQLGAEKTVSRIGRPVTVWTGAPVEEELFFPKGEAVTLPERAIDLGRRDDMRMTSPKPFTEVATPGTVVRIRRWPQSETRIEWQGKRLALGEGDHVAERGDWQAFAESLPNIEVRLGAILALERIAQDSTATDEGRDHVRVMQILCAYIRENAPASEAEGHDLRPWAPLSRDASPEERLAHRRLREQRFGEYGTVYRGAARRWAKQLPKPRADIQVALDVLGRRTPAQLQVEARWGTDSMLHAAWVFDTPCPRLPARGTDLPPLGKEAISHFRGELDAWKRHLSEYRGYRLDLRATNLQRADLANVVLSGALLNGARMEGADLAKARLVGADLTASRLEGADVREARIQGAVLERARMEGADLGGARMEGAELTCANLDGAHLREAHLEGAKLSFPTIRRLCASLQEADLQEVHLESVELGGVWLQGADLRGAWMEEANLNGADVAGLDLTKARMERAHLADADLRSTALGAARMEGAFFFTARMDETTRFPNTTVRGAALKDVIVPAGVLSAEQTASMFGDGSVTLPDDLPRPMNWPTWELGDSFIPQWRKWQDDPKGYRPPSPPK